MTMNDKERELKHASTQCTTEPSRLRARAQSWWAISRQHNRASVTLLPARQSSYWLEALLIVLLCSNCQAAEAGKEIVVTAKTTNDGPVIEPSQYRLKDKGNDFVLAFKADGTMVWFVKFKELPPEVTIVPVTRAVAGKYYGKPVANQGWYPFQKDLQFQVAVSAIPAKLSVTVLFELTFNKVFPLKTNWLEAKIWADKQAFRQDLYSRELQLVVPVTKPSSPPIEIASSNTGTKSAVSRSDSNLDDVLNWLYSPEGFLAFFFLLVLLLVLFWAIHESVQGWFYRLRHYLHNKKHKKHKPSPPTSSERIEDFMPETPSSGSDDDRGYDSKGNRESNETPFPLNRIMQTGAAPRMVDELPTTGRDHYDQVFEGAPRSDRDNQRLVTETSLALEPRLKAVEQYVAVKIYDVQEYLRKAIGNLSSDIKQQGASWKTLNDSISTNERETAKLVKKEIAGLTNIVTPQLQALTDRLERVQTESGQHKKELVTLEKRLQSELESLREALKQSTAQKQAHEEFYARTLGLSLGNSVTLLREDAFAQFAAQVGENLNQFFKDGIKRDGVANLSQKADNICGALRKLIGTLQSFEPGVANELTRYLSEAENLALELGALSHEVQSRNLTLDLILKVQVSATNSARHSFLEELGLAMQKELEKWRDPQTHCAERLERLIKDSLVQMVGVCDSKLGVPSTKPQFNQDLEKLLEQAGLKSILPRPKIDLYQSAEHELYELIPPQSANERDKIARVLQRGFQYRASEQEPWQLHRRAQVNVYR